MKKRVQVVNQQLERALCKVKEVLRNKDGFGVIEIIIFACIVILAILAIRPLIVGAFSDTATSWRTWIAERLQEVFN